MSLHPHRQGGGQLARCTRHDSTGLPAHESPKVEHPLSQLGNWAFLNGEIGGNHHDLVKGRSVPDDEGQVSRKTDR